MLHQGLSGGILNKWVLGLIALCLSLLPGVAHADESRLEIRVQLSSALRVTVQGTLSDASGGAIAGARVQAHLTTHHVSDATTGQGGGFTMEFDVPAALRAGNRQLVITHDGSSGNGPARASVTLALGGEPSSDRSQAPDRSTPARPALAQARLSATPATINPVNGSVVELSGKLTDESGRAIAGGGVEVHDHRGESGDSFTITQSDGTFSTYYEVPVEHEGTLRLTLRYPGAIGYAPAQASINLDVRVVEVALPAPTPDELQTLVPEMAPGVDEAEEAPLAEVADSIGTQVAPPTPAEPEDEPAAGMSQWLIGAVAAVGGAAVLIGVVIVTTVVRRRDEQRDADFALFDEI